MKQQKSTTETIRKALISHLEELGYHAGEERLTSSETIDKETVRRLYRARRHARETDEHSFVTGRIDELITHYASGNEIQPAGISPVLEEVHANTWQSDLFRLSTLLWSVPVSRGFGRRMRFLVWDKSNGKLMGLIALGDPVFNLRARDSWIGWSSKDREERLCNVLDAYILGAVPPYSKLLVGKLIAALVASREVNDVFRRRYSKQQGVISKKVKDPRLVLVTTTSALGRSSIYNRLKLDERTLFQRIGFTEGWGHFHISDDLFHQMKGFLAARDHKYANGYKYGNGPNWRMRVIRETFSQIGISQDYLHHGIQREVFAVPLASNYREILLGLKKRPKWQLMPASEIGEFCVKRWILPRSERDGSECRSVTLEQIRNSLLRNGT